MEEEFLLNGLSFTVTIDDQNDKVQLEDIIDDIITQYGLKETKENFLINRKDYRYIYDYNNVAICVIEDEKKDVNASKEGAQISDVSFFVKKINISFKEQNVITLKEIGTNIFSVKITGKKYYTFHFFNLNHYQEMELISYKGHVESDKEDVLNLYKKIYPNPLIDDSKSHVYVDFMEALKKNNFFKRTTYLSMSSKIQFQDTENYKQYRLIHFFTKKDNKFYKIYKFEQNIDVLTTNIQYYKYAIYNVEDFIKQLRGHLVNLEDNIKKYKKEIPNLSMDEKDKVTLLLDTIDLNSMYTMITNISLVIQIITGNAFLELHRDKDDKFNNFYIFSPENPFEVFICNGYYKFYPVIDKNSNYFSLHHDEDGKEYGIILRNRDNIKMKVKNRLICTYHINQWNTTNKEILQKYKDKKKHKYRFSDDDEDVNEVINKFLQKYILIKVSDTKLLEELDTYTLDNKINTKAKLLKKIRANIHVQEYPLSSTVFQ